MNDSNQLFKYGYVINLDARGERWLRMQSQLESFGLAHFQRFSAVAASEMKLNAVPVNFFNNISQGLKKSSEQNNIEYCVKAAWGCLQSHLGVINKALAEQYPSVVIFEDDCELEPHFQKIIDKLTAQLSTLNWDVIYLGGNVHRKSSLSKHKRNLLKGHGITLCHAMIINQTVYKTILSEAPMSGMSIDDYYRKVLQRKANVLLVSPQLAYQFYTDISDISLSRKKFKFNSSNLKRRFIRWWNRLIYSF